MRHEDPGNRQYIGLISATPAEGGYIAGKMRRVKKAFSGHLQFFQGSIHGRDIVFVASGVGKTNASHAATVLIRDYAPACVINFGIGGAFPSSGLKTGDLAVAEKEIYGDEGAADRRGFLGMESLGIPLLRKGSKKYFNEFALDRRLREKAVASAQRISSARTGTFLTVSTCTGTRKKASELKIKFNPLCENMEGAAIAHICTLYGVPMAEIRGISNHVGDRDVLQWNIPLASENCQRSVEELLRVL